MKIFVGVVSLLSAWALGCGAAQFALKRPIANQCASHGLRQCDEIVDGVMSYVDGDKAKAETELRTAAAGNSPEQVREFANALKPIAENVGGDGGDALRGVIALLTDGGPAGAATAARTGSAAAGGNTAPPPKGAEPAAARALDGTATTATTSGAGAEEYEQMRTFSVPGGLGDQAKECGPGVMASGTSTCKRTRVAVGPMIITNLYSSGGCPDELFVASGRADRPQWLVLVQPNASLNVSGKLSLDDGEDLFVGVRAAREPKADIHCTVTWSGYKPRAVPVRASTSASELGP